MECFCESLPANVWMDTWRRASHRPSQEESALSFPPGRESHLAPTSCAGNWGIGRLADVTSV